MININKKKDNKMKKVGIVTIIGNNNYGNRLQKGSINPK